MTEEPAPATLSRVLGLRELIYIVIGCVIGSGIFIVPGAVLTWLFMRAVPTDILALAQPGASLMLPMVLLLAIWLWAIVDAWRAGGR